MYVFRFVTMEWKINSHKKLNSVIHVFMCHNVTKIMSQCHTTNYVAFLNRIKFLFKPCCFKFFQHVINSKKATL